MRRPVVIGAVSAVVIAGAFGVGALTAGSGSHPHDRAASLMADSARSDTTDTTAPVGPKGWLFTGNGFVQFVQLTPTAGDVLVLGSNLTGSMQTASAYGQPPDEKVSSRTGKVSGSVH